MISDDGPSEDRKAGSDSTVLPEEQQGAGQPVLVALADGDGRSQAEVVEVNMYDLVNSNVAFICEDKASGADS